MATDIAGDELLCWRLARLLPPTPGCRAHCRLIEEVRQLRERVRELEKREDECQTISR
jgi:hypothetical protein